MVSPSDKGVLRDASIEEIEFDAAETEELDKLAEKLAKAAYPGKILRQNWAYEAIYCSPRTSSLFCGLRAPAPSAHLPFISSTPAKATAFREPGPP